MDKVKLYILSGFLGSGKTTALNHIIHHFKDQKLVVLMNEFGDFNVDGHLIKDAPVKEMKNGCICCDLKSDVEVQLHDVKNRYQPDIIIIEATGIAHPIEIYDACLATSVTDWLKVMQIITVVDGPRFQNKDILSPQTKNLMIDQIKYAHTILLNKVDLMNDSECIKVKQELKMIQPHAAIIETIKGDFDIEVLDEAYTTHYQKTHHHHGIQSIVYTFSGPIDARKFMDWLRQLPQQILRIKGFIKFIESGNQVILFQYAYGVPQFEEEMMNLPLKIVIIGEDFDKSRLLDQLDQLQFG